MNATPAAPKTSVDRCCAAPCRAAAPPRDSASMVERMLWRHVSARDCTRCILKESNKKVAFVTEVFYPRLNLCEGDKTASLFKKKISHKEDILI